MTLIPESSSLLQIAGILFFLVWGSFMAGFYARLLNYYAPNAAPNLPLWRGRSACPHCAKPLAWLHMIPVLSWFLLRGKCSTCTHPISFAYPLIEGLSPALFILHFYISGQFEPAIFINLVILILITMALIDLKYLILPDPLQTILFVTWFVFLSCQTDPFDHFITGLVGAGFAASLLLGLRYLFFKIKHQEGLGLGDVKLATIAGLWLGIQYMPWLLMIASIGTLIVILLARKTITAHIPFGPGLCAGFYVTLFMKLIINQ
jgi:leader peptidase (prepilin peptidase)/N-methyltransferase